jgi:hypothetical protein
VLFESSNAPRTDSFVHLRHTTVQPVEWREEDGQAKKRFVAALGNADEPAISKKILWRKI